MTAPTLTDCAQMDPDAAIRAIYIRSLLLLALLVAVGMIDVLAPRPSDSTPSPASSAVDGAAGRGLR